MSLESIMAYARFHLSGGVNAKGEQVLSRASVELMRTPQLLKQPTTDEMGVGWHLRARGGRAHRGPVWNGWGSLPPSPDHSRARPRLRHPDEPHERLAPQFRGREGGPEPVRRTRARSRPGHRGQSRRQRGHDRARRSAPERTCTRGLCREVRPDADGGYDVTVRDGRLIAATSAGDRPLTFWGRDLAYQDTADANHGIPVEFIRDGQGAVQWLRFNGRIARKA